MLQRQINSLAFERVMQHPKTIVEKPTIQSLIKDPTFLNFWVCLLIRLIWGLHLVFFGVSNF